MVYMLRVIEKKDKILDFPRQKSLIVKIWTIKLIKTSWQEKAVIWLFLHNII